MCSATEQFADGCSALCWGGTNTVKSISPLPRSAALNKIAMSSSLTCNMPRLFSPNIISFVRDELQCPYFINMHFLNSLYYLYDIINVTLSSCLIASVLHDCVMASAQHQDLNSALMRFSRFMTLLSLEGSHCVCENVCVWERVHTCQWTLMMAAVKSCRMNTWEFKLFVISF